MKTTQTYQTDHTARRLSALGAAASDRITQLEADRDFWQTQADRLGLVIAELKRQHAETVTTFQFVLLLAAAVIVAELALLFYLTQR